MSASGSDSDDIPIAQRVKHETSASKVLKKRNSIDANVLRENICWACHKKISEYEIIAKCSECVLRFHMNCVTDITREKPGWNCSECQTSKEPEDFWSMGEYSLGDFFLSVFETLVKDIGGLDIPGGYTDNKLLVNAVTFDDIKLKVERAEYTSTHAFLMDFKWLQHNMEILCRYGGSRLRTTFAEARDDARKLLKKCIKEIMELKSCGECYMKDINCHEKYRVCSRPHLVIWVQFSKFPYWPCKLLQIGEGSKQPLQVFFFGGYEIASVNYVNCYLYSKEHPNESIPDHHKKDMEIAMSDAAKYIAKIEERFGPFRYAPPKTKLVRGKLDNEQYDQMIPGFNCPELRLRPLELQFPEESRNDNNNGNGNNNDIVGMDDIANTTQNVSEESGDNVKILRIDAAFLEKVDLLRGMVSDLKAHLVSQRTKIAELETKNAALAHEKCITKGNFDAQLSQLRKEIDALKHEKNVQDAAHVQIIAENKAKEEEIVRLCTKIGTLEGKLKSKRDDDFERQTQVKLSQWCSVCLDKMPSKITTICNDCNPSSAF